MYSLMNKFYTAVAQQTGKLLLLILITASIATANAQNVNKPNKMGPMGTQVNTFTGNLFISRNDIYVPARGFDLDISFNYNSFNYEQNNGFGNGWSNDYSIKYKNDTAGSKTIIWGDGREDNYSMLSASAFKSPKGFFTVFSQYQPNKYLLAETDGTKFYFDNSTHKRITKMEEPNGNYINFNYTDTLLTSLVNTAGQTISFTYTGTGKLATVVDAVTTPTRTYTYTYDGTGNLTKVTDPLGGTNKYSYLINGPMKTMTDKNNNTVDIIYYNDFSISEIIGCNKRVSFSYDTATNITIATDHLTTGSNQVTKYKYKKFEDQVWLISMSGNCCGYNMSFEFDNNGNKIKEADGKGNVYNYTYDVKGNVKSIKDPLNNISTFTYSPDFNKIAGYTDYGGNLHTIIYDVKGNPTQLTEPGGLNYTFTYNANGDLTGTVDPKGNTYVYTYDSYGNPATITGPNAYTASMNFDPRGNLLSYTDARGNNFSALYDLLNRRKKITDPFQNFFQLNYDAEGNAISVINKNNETTLLGYDASNRIVKYTNVLGKQSFFSYDGMNNLTGVKNPLGNEVALGYDSRNRLGSIKFPLNNNVNFDYDAAGNLTGAALSNGRTLSYTYDNLNRLISAQDGGGSLGSVTYDRNDNVTSFTNPTGATSTAAYDNLNRLKTITDPLGNSKTYNYDNGDNVISIVDKNGNTTYLTYDSSDRVKTYTDRNGFVITVSYDAAGNIIQLKDQKNNITTYTYDSLNRVKITTYPDGKFTQNTYDKKGNVIARRLTDLTVINLQYDSLNRVKVKALPDGNVYSYVYDAAGRMIAATNNNVAVTIAYDAFDRIISETMDNHTTRYSYNTAGRTQTTIYPDSTVIIKSFDTRNRLISIAKNNSIIASYQYNAANQVTVKNYANAVNTNIQYDIANRLSNILTAGGLIQNTSFTYEKHNNKTAINRQNNAALSEQFTYDNDYRLTVYKRGIPGGTPVIQNTYNFDAAGNRANANLNGTNTTYTINNLNQLTNLNNGSQNINFTYDDNGNLTYDGIFYKKYDAEGRILSDSASPSNKVSYQYDAFGRRIKKTVNTRGFNYYYAGLRQIEERDGNTDTIINRTLFGNFLTPVMNEKNNKKFYYHQDELNSVEAISSDNGNLAERYQYDPYGQPTIYDPAGNVITSSATGNRFGITGQEYDNVTASYHFHYRNYSPQTGTFNQRDPIGYGDGMAMYQYVRNNPANGIDVLGLTIGDGSDTPQDLFNLANAAGTATDMHFNDLEKGLQQKIIDIWSKAKNSKQARKKAIEKIMQLEQFALANNRLKFGKLLGKLNPAVNTADLAYKTYKLNRALHPCPGDKPLTDLEILKLQKDVALAAGGYNPLVATYNLIDYGIELTVGKSLTDMELDLGDGINKYIEKNPTLDRALDFDPVVGLTRQLGYWAGYFGF